MGDKAFSITVIVATHKRRDSVRALLNSLSRQTLSSSLWNVIVVENGMSRDRFLSSGSRLRSVICIHEQVAGKSAALNRAIEVAAGDLLVFTDDDVDPDPEWLSSLHHSALAYKEVDGFCGPIVPVFPEALVPQLLDHPFRSCAFSEFLPRLGNELLPHRIQPFGPNLAIRRRALGAVRFRTQLGPSRLNGVLSCDDIDFAARLRIAGCRFWYVPQALVKHKIRKEQLTLGWLGGRAFSFGRSLVAMFDPRPRIYEAFWDPSGCRTTATLDRLLRASFYLGQHAEFVRRGGVCPVVRNALAAQLSCHLDKEVLGSLILDARKVATTYICSTSHNDTTVVTRGE